MSYTIKGKLKVIKDVVFVSDKFSKREFVLDVKDGEYTQYPSFQCNNENIMQLDPFSEGDEVTVHFNVKGREWKSPQGEMKYFNSLETWKITA